MTANPHNNHGQGQPRDAGGESQGNRGQYAGANEYHIPTKCSQVEFLRFNGEDLGGWIYKCEQFFDIDETPFDAKVKLTAVHMEGKALQWHQVYMKSRLTREMPHWEEYVPALNDRFGTFLFEDPMSELMNLKYTGKIQEYMDRFDEILNCLELTEAYVEVISLARLQEQALKLSCSSKSSLSIKNHKSSSHFSRPLAFTQPPKPPVPNFSTLYSSNRFTPMPAHKVANQNHRPLLQSRRMSPQEIDEKALEEDESLVHKEVEEEEYQQQDVPTQEDDCPNFHISVNAMTGVHNYNTMRVTDYCKGKAINILINTRSTHNFVDFQVARRLGCKLEATHPFPVAVANGNRVYSTHTCKNFNRIFQGVDFVTEVMTLPLEEIGTDIVAKCGLLHREEATDSRLFSSEGQTTEEQGNLDTLLTEYANLFEEPKALPPKRRHDHGINLREGTSAINIRPYRYPVVVVQKDEIEKLVQEMLDSGVIRESNSPYSSPVVRVKKKDGSWRMCIDYRELNKHHEG
ncbi:UNVERIFIED_CONTAM: Transposon Ty3-G Gag-Pol polyprotein [Sesamum latifolium]|uniref:Transposon Ty3-G Gag-Pol polyprotein n=1 Tax=Sesamum latifolium TaxID=2727402 RepID=A0AAW2VE70_9LAMI